MNFLKCNISRVLVLYIVLFSSFVTLILTAMQLRIDYNYGISVLEQQLDQIQHTNLESITESVWIVDDSLMKLQLQGLSRLPDIIFVELVDDGGARIQSVGKVDTRHVLDKSYALIKQYRDNDIKLGQLHIVATKVNIYQRLWDTVLIILVSQAIKTFLVSLFILIVFNYLVTRHLSDIADFLEYINVKKKSDHLKLDRKLPGERGDELDRVVQSVNSMMDDNHKHYIELKESQNLLSESEARFLAIFNSISDSIVVSDVHRNILVVNPAFNRQFRYEDEFPDTIDSVFALESEDDNKIINRYESIIHNSMEETLYLQFSRKDGDCFDGEISSSKVMLPGGQHVAYLSIIRDITLRKQNEKEKLQLMQELQQSQKMESIGLLVGGIAHDFNNILGSIIGYSELASDHIEDDDHTLARYLSSIISSGERASDLIKQLLAFSRRTSSEPVKIDLTRLVDEISNMLKPLLPATIELQLDMADKLPGIMFDYTQIQQVLLNICLNARDAMEGRGVLNLSVSSEKIHDLACRSCGNSISGEYVVIEIADTGSGISEDVLDKIFEPFFTTKKQGEGTGMGLSVVHGILHKHNSHIVVDSIQGAGTTFKLYIPAIEFKDEDIEISIKEDNFHVENNSSKHILIVDDEEMLAGFLQDYLENIGFIVTVSTDPVQALKLFQAEYKNIDLLVTDQTMPQMTGIELIRQIHFYKPELPVILCSGLNDELDKRELETHGIDLYMQKPVKGKQILASINQLINQ